MAVAEAGGITLAARRLGLTQPAVSQCIAQLEEEAGGALFERVRSGVILTPRGERFMHFAHEILSLYESLDSVMRGALMPQRRESFELPDGRTAVVSMTDGKLEIDLN